ncbi:Putative NAD(P)-binding domain, NAD(P)-binding domain superfamily [Septoria linicola]|uniref:NAD(P)-binding domain, NAD(P)-binding domain superfamily n=1 Tax=Septoria linicola TaxID=215465 RepID=A0A9Q9EM10_9PEZI|nr:putative NAD(P)-binding domain, NAD(P)-binding domain superfamily [Septoria linicola]USW53973.1 Putative NAD(P)-binding domain, NAD(P)-binding domain superfamily [Septoria linicola]
MSSNNNIRNVAIVGGAGNSGSYMTAELLKTGKHTVTAISRADSNSNFPKGVRVARVDYKQPETLVEALRGQDVLVITLSVFAESTQQKALIEAAGEAEVPWILPNEWCPDTADEGLVRDVAPFQGNVATRKLIGDLGKSSYISVVNGFWYEWSLSIPSAFGIDINKKEATLFDDGRTRISTTTWPQVGRAVAALLSLPVKAENGSNEACLEAFRNQLVYIKSFTISQREMLESIFRVSATNESDWRISKERAEERYAEGSKAMIEGDRLGYVRMMYTRVFYADGNGDYESRKGVSNADLGLPTEDIDAATRVAVERAKTWAFRSI